MGSKWTGQQMIQIIAALRDNKIPICPECTHNLIIHEIKIDSEKFEINVECQTCRKTASVSGRENSKKQNN